MIVSAPSHYNLPSRQCVYLSAVLEINFEELDYAIEEGSYLPIILQFRKIQNPFTVRISTVTIGTAASLDLGSFIDLTPDSNATEGLLNA